jgi:hypothetical protein
LERDFGIIEEEFEVVCRRKRKIGRMKEEWKIRGGLGRGRMVKKWTA